jgi:hypothetical protein
MSRNVKPEPIKITQYPVVDGFHMGQIDWLYWNPQGSSDRGRWRVIWQYQSSPATKRRPARIEENHHDLSSLAEAEAYLVARSKYEGHEPGFTIRIIDKAEHPPMRA